MLAINGYEIELVEGSLLVYKDGALIQRTKGDPTKAGNPPFASMDEAVEYFTTMGLGIPQPELIVEENVNG